MITELEDYVIVSDPLVISNYCELERVMALVDFRSTVIIFGMLSTVGTATQVLMSVQSDGVFFADCNVSITRLTRSHCILLTCHES